VKGNLHIAALLRHRGFDAEQRAAQLAQAFHDVRLGGCHAEPESSGMQRAITHEVAHQLRQVGGHPARHDVLRIGWGMRMVSSFAPLRYDITVMLEHV